MRTRSVVLAAIFAALLAAALLMSRQPACETGGHAAKGDVRREASGKLLYFDGQCWTPKPLTPQDSLF
jgi:hypothetical protein